MPHWKSFARFEEWQKSKGITSFLMGDNQPMIDFLSDNPDMVSESNKPGGYGIDDITQFENLYKISPFIIFFKFLFSSFCLK